MSPGAADGSSILAENRPIRGRRHAKLLERVLPLLTGSAPNPAVEYCCFGLYLTLVAVGVSRHEPWFDEAQAWLLARDLDFVTLMTRALRYEGTPGLWHALLFAAQKAGAPYVSVSVLGALGASVGAFLIFRYSPFPLLLRCLLPFTFFLAFQYAVVARSYNLMLPLLFSLAILHPRRRSRPFQVAACRVALSQLSLHGLIISSALVVHEGAGWIRRRERPSRAQLVSLMLFGVSGLVIAWQLVPPRDLGAAYRFYWGWDRFAIVSVDFLHASIAESGLVSEAVLAVTLVWLFRRRQLTLYLLPATLVLSIFAFRYANVWHQGIIFALWIFALWVSFDRRTRPAEPSLLRLEALTSAGLLLVITIQLVWTVKTYAYDIRRPYSGSLALSQFLKTLDLNGARIHIDGFKPVAALPYFDRNIYANLNGGENRSYWVWSSSNRLLTDPQSVWDGQPDLAILTRPIHLEQEKPRPGYRDLTRFPGGLYWKTRIYEPDTYRIEVRQNGRFGALSPP